MAQKFASRSEVIPTNRPRGRPPLSKLDREARKLDKQSDPLANISDAVKTALDELVKGATVHEAAATASLTVPTLRTRMCEAASIAALAIMRTAHRELHRDRAFHKLLELAGVIEGVPPAAEQKDQIKALERVLDMCGDNSRERIYERIVKAREAGADVRLPYEGPNSVPPQMPTLNLIITEGQAENAPEGCVIDHEPAPEPGDRS